MNIAVIMAIKIKDARANGIISGNLKVFLSMQASTIKITICNTKPINGTQLIIPKTNKNNNHIPQVNVDWFGARVFAGFSVAGASVNTAAVCACESCCSFGLD